MFFSERDLGWVSEGETLQESELMKGKGLGQVWTCGWYRRCMWTEHDERLEGLRTWGLLYHPAAEMCLFWHTRDTRDTLSLFHTHAHACKWINTQSTNPVPAPSWPFFTLTLPFLIPSVIFGSPTPSRFASSHLAHKSTHVQTQWLYPSTIWAPAFQEKKEKKKKKWLPSNKFIFNVFWVFRHRHFCVTLKMCKCVSLNKKNRNKYKMLAVKKHREPKLLSVCVTCEDLSKVRTCPAFHPVEKLQHLSESSGVWSSTWVLERTFYFDQLVTWPGCTPPSPSWSWYKRHLMMQWRYSATDNKGAKGIWDIYHVNTNLLSSSGVVLGCGGFTIKPGFSPFLLLA